MHADAPVPEGEIPLMVDGEDSFLQQLKALGDNVSTATYTYYALDSILQKGSSIGATLNRHPYFWKAAMNALQVDYLLALTRTIEPRNRRGDLRSKINLLKLIEVLKNHRAIFYKRNLRNRVHSKFEGDPHRLSQFMKRASGLTEAEISNLERDFDGYLEIRNNLMVLRDKVVAHGDISDAEEIRELFQQVPKKEVEKLLEFLHQVKVALWLLYNNGHSPTWKPKPLPQWRRSLADDVSQDVSTFLDTLAKRR